MAPRLLLLLLMGLACGATGVDGQRQPARWAAPAPAHWALRRVGGDPPPSETVAPPSLVDTVDTADAAADHTHRDSATDMKPFDDSPTMMVADRRWVGFKDPSQYAIKAKPAAKPAHVAALHHVTGIFKKKPTATPQPFLSKRQTQEGARAALLEDKLLGSIKEKLDSYERVQRPEQEAIQARQLGDAMMVDELKKKKTKLQLQATGNKTIEKQAAPRDAAVGEAEQEVDAAKYEALKRSVATPKSKPASGKKAKAKAAPATTQTKVAFITVFGEPLGFGAFVVALLVLAFVIMAALKYTKDKDAGDDWTMTWDPEAAMKATLASMRGGGNDTPPASEEEEQLRRQQTRSKLRKIALAEKKKARHRQLREEP